MAETRRRRSPPGRPDDLPDFTNPPVSEVLLGVQFGNLRALRMVDTGKLWDIFRKQFPKCEERPPLSPAFETFGPELIRSGAVKFEALPRLPLPRLWFLNRTGNELIQFQVDRFVHNWRKIGVGDKYPRYERIKSQFMRELRKLQKFSRAEGLGEIKPNQCEVTYINFVVGDGKIPPSLGTVFRFWSDRGVGGVSGFERGQIDLGFVLRSESNQPIGRLIVKAGPGRDKEGRIGIRFELTARGQPRKPTSRGVSEFLDLGRRAIVEGFADLTTKKMHSEWERRK